MSNNSTHGISITFVLVILASTLSSCFPESDKRHEIILDIRNTWDEFIEKWEAQDAAGLADFYTADGFNIPNEFKTNRGRDEIEKFYEFLFSMNQSSNYTHEMLHLSFSGNMAVELGEFKVDWINNDGEAWTYKARSLTHWVLEDDSWKIRAILFNQAPVSE